MFEDMELMDFTTSIGMEEDPFEFNPIFHKYNNFLIMSSIGSLSFILVNIICFYNEMMMSGGEEFVGKYLSYIGLLHAALLIQISFLYYGNRVLYYSEIMKKRGYSWSLMSGGSVFHAKIKTEFRTIKFLRHATSILCSLALFSYLPVVGDEYKWHYMKEFLRNKGVGYGVLWDVLFSLFLGSCVAPTMINIDTVFYLAIHTRLQLQIFNNFMRRYNEDGITTYGVNDCSSQKIVGQFLKQCVFMHVHILETKKILYRRTSGAILLTIFILILVYSSSGYFIYSGVSPPSNVRMCLWQILFFAFSVTSTIMCQLLIHESENLQHNLLELPWYTWNTENRKVYLMMLKNSSKPMSVSAYGIWEVNLALLLKVFRGCYAALSVLVKMENINSDWHN